MCVENSSPGALSKMCGGYAVAQFCLICHQSAAGFPFVHTVGRVRWLSRHCRRSAALTSSNSTSLLSVCLLNMRRQSFGESFWTSVNESATMISWRCRGSVHYCVSAFGAHRCSLRSSALSDSDSEKTPKLHQRKRTVKWSYLTGDFACLIASMDWRSIKRRQCLGLQHIVWIYLRWIDPLTPLALLSEGSN